MLIIWRFFFQYLEIKKKSFIEANLNVFNNINVQIDKYWSRDLLHFYSNQTIVMVSIDFQMEIEQIALLITYLLVFWI